MIFGESFVSPGYPYGAKKFSGIGCTIQQDEHNVPYLMLDNGEKRESDACVHINSVQHGSVICKDPEGTYLIVIVEVEGFVPGGSDVHTTEYVFPLNSNLIEWVSGEEEEMYENTFVLI